MAGIPPILSGPLRQVLLDCGPFDNDRQLRAVFADGRLSPWRYSLPQADSLTDRVDAVIAFLIEKRRSDTKENALVLLLHVLSERLDPVDECHPRLATLASELELALESRTPFDQLAKEANPTGSGSMIYIAVDEKLLACAKAVGLVSVPKFAKGQMERVITGTGWLVTTNLALTCWHVIEARTQWDGSIGETELQQQLANTLLIFDYNQPSQGIEYILKSLEYHNPDLDYALLRLKDRANPPLHQRGFLTLDTDPALTQQMQLFILQHPKGQGQQRAAGHYIKSAAGSNRIFYDTPTDVGTSGAPVLNVPNWRVIALHNGENKGEKLREGTLLKTILSDLAQHRLDLYQEILDAQSNKE